MFSLTYLLLTVEQMYAICRADLTLLLYIIRFPKNETCLKLLQSNHFLILHIG